MDEIKQCYVIVNHTDILSTKNRRYPMRSINLFSNLVLVFFLILSTGFSFANESTRDVEAQKPATKLLKKAGQDIRIVPVAAGVVAGVTLHGILGYEETTNIVVASAVAGLTTASLIMCQNVFYNLRNKNKSKSE